MQRCKVKSRSDVHQSPNIVWNGRVTVLNMIQVDTRSKWPKEPDVYAQFSLSLLENRDCARCLSSFMSVALHKVESSIAGKSLNHSDYHPREVTNCALRCINKKGKPCVLCRTLSPSLARLPQLHFLIVISSPRN